MRSLSTLLCAICSLAAMNADYASAQNYPTRPVRIITGGAGGGNDVISRLLAQGISGPLGQQVIVDNRPSGVIPAEITSKSAPDGYTLLLYSGGMWILPLMQTVPYDMKDFAPISIVARAPNFLVVHPSVPAKSVKELIALAKARPGQLNYSAGALGASSHLAAELFKFMAHVDIVHIPYKAGSNETADLIGGQVQLTFGTAAVVPHVKSGRLRALAVTSREPSALMPGLPTVAAAVPGYESGSLYGLFAPAKTPAAILTRINQETVKFLSTPAAKEKYLSAGLEASPSSPDEFAAAIRGEVARLGKMIKEAGIKVD